MVTWQAIAGILGAIALIGSAGAVVHKWVSPIFKANEDIKKLKEDVEKLKSREQSDMSALTELRQLSKLQARSMITIMNHMIDGNHVADMKETRDEIQDLLIRI